MIEVKFPEPLQCLFRPKRHKVLYGGRAAGRSWGVARALLIEGVRRPLRILCVREFQNSITESVHQLLRDQILLLGLDGEYEVLEQVIRGRNGTQFTFAGIKNNVTKIKSFEGIDICWAEEADKISQNSWLVLLPTIRKDGSEIWITFNPQLESDYTYRYFVKESNTDPLTGDTTVVKMTWRDNPWITPEMIAEKDKLRRTDYDLYLNIWEGFCLEVLEGTVYVKEIRQALAEGRIMSVPYHRETPVDTFWDLGRADKTAIWFAQRVAMQYRILAYYEASGEDIHHFLLELQQRGYIYGRHYLPHDGTAQRLVSKKSIEQIVRTSYPGRVSIVPKQQLVDGINAARMIFPNCFFDEERCADGLRALKGYRYKMLEGQRSAQPVHDWASDGADAFRYMALAWRGPKDITGEVVDSRLARLGSIKKTELVALGAHGWMG